jgi:arylsulfatase A-like enzyme
MAGTLDRRTFLKASAAGAVGAASDAAAQEGPAESSEPSQPTTNHPNVLFILSDQHNAKFLSCKNHPDVKTPNLDRLAAEGVRFENAICQNPICTPSRTSYISGQYCHNHGYYGLNGPRPKGLPTIFSHFRKAGYTTAAVGKIHCPAYWVEDDTDYFMDMGCSIGGKTDYVPYLKEKGLLHLRDDGRYPEQPKGGGQSLDGRKSSLSYEDSVEGWFTRLGMGFMEGAVQDGTPFFLHLSLPKPHQIYAPSEPFWSMYDESTITLPPNADYDMSLKAPHLRRTAEAHRTGKWTLFEPRTFEAGRLRKLHGYLGCVSHMDHAVGEVLRRLDELGIADNTIVVYGADHGDYGCEHGLMEKAPGICGDAVTRIPFIWRWPERFKAGHVAEEIVETVDMGATLCALTGLDPFETSDGKDISHLLRGENGEVHAVGVTECPWSKSVRKGKFRLVYYAPEMFPKEMFRDWAYPDGDFGELYDLEADPWEMRNLYFEPDYAAVIQELKQDLLDWTITTNRPATIHPPANFEGDQAFREYGSTVNADGKIHPDRIRKARGRNYI